MKRVSAPPSIAAYLKNLNHSDIDKILNYKVVSGRLSNKKKTPSLTVKDEFTLAILKHVCPPEVYKTFYETVIFKTTKKKIK